LAPQSHTTLRAASTPRLRPCGVASRWAAPPQRPWHCTGRFQSDPGVRPVVKNDPDGSHVRNSLFLKPTVVERESHDLMLAASRLAPSGARRVRSCPSRSAVFILAHPPSPLAMAGQVRQQPLRLRVAMCTRTGTLSTSAPFDARRLTARTPSEHVAFAPVHSAPRNSNHRESLRRLSQKHPGAHRLRDRFAQPLDQAYRMTAGTDLRAVRRVKWE
jgi:hypothetical protein